MGAVSPLPRHRRGRGGSTSRCRAAQTILPHDHAVHPYQREE
ncbi:hypothetical protein FGU71_11215 [Erythrobacter insulae]|uniref:Uncharacterized protein n=1 Tax=Erythrobacter insulae TaxID=2584124 RepID=A0A547PFB8_9SPHN|nr:hypothetical protein FGU71_11215 [Erythrobacter insulae]